MCTPTHERTNRCGLSQRDSQSNVGAELTTCYSEEDTDYCSQPASQLESPLRKEDNTETRSVEASDRRACGASA
jgi:hypothetical protein